jgi:uncharacterized repeat protein (TIGR03943 family)
MVAAVSMNIRTQGVVLTMFAAVCARLAFTDVYLRYVNAWMKWPLLITSAILLVLAARVVFKSDVTAEDDDKAPPAAWFLVLPVVAVFVVSPPALGAYAAERNPVVVTPEDDGMAMLPRDENGVIKMQVGEFASRAQWDDTLRGHKVALHGFVSKDKAGHWYVTRLAISCCAADALAYRVKVAGAEEPTRDTWVRVTGTWVKSDDKDIPRVKEPPLIQAESVEPAEQPRNPYE